MAPKFVAIFCFIAVFQVSCINAFRNDYIYIPSTGAYYKYNHRERAEWEVANSTCQSEGAMLFYPENEDELNEVFRVFNVPIGDWLATGFSDLEIFHLFKTVDGRPISQVYSKWLPNEPSPGENNDHRCGFMDVRTRLLFVHRCANSQLYICKYKSTNQTILAAEEETDDTITDSYTYIPSTGYYYKYHPEHAKWQDAKSTCQSEGAILFNPENGDEINEVFSVFNVSNVVCIATGISDLETLHDYKTVDGRPISEVYSNWRSDQPYSGLFNQYRCVYMDSDYELFVGMCSFTRPYICKYEYNASMGNGTMDAVTDVKMIIADATNKIVGAPERQAKNQTAAIDDIERQTEVAQRNSLNQTLALQQQLNYLKHQAAYQNTALECIIEVLSRQTDAMQKQAANQIAAMANQIAATERLAQVLDRIATLQEQEIWTAKATPFKNRSSG